MEDLGERANTEEPNNFDSKPRLTLFREIKLNSFTAREGINASSVNPQIDGRDRYILDGVVGYMFLLVDACSSASLWFY